MNTAMLEQKNVILDLDYLENLVEQENSQEKIIADLINLEDYLVEQEPKKVPFTTEEAIWLDHALFLQPYKTNSKEVKALTSKIFQEIKTNHKQRINEPDKTQKMLEKVIINLWKGYFCDQPIMYYRNKNAYTQPKRYQESHFTYKRILTVTDNLKELGYINMAKGFYNEEGDEEDKPSKVTRIWATTKLLENFLNYKDVVLPDFCEPTLPKETIILKEDDEDKTNKSKKNKNKKKKKNVDYKDNKYTRAMRDNLSIYNQYNDKQDFDIVLDGETEVTNSFIAECLHKNITSRMMRIKKVLIREEVEELKIGLKSKEYVHEAEIFKKVKSLYKKPKSYIQRKNSESIHQDNVIKYEFLKHIEEMTDYNKTGASITIHDYDSDNTFKQTYEIPSEISKVTNNGLDVALPDYESNNKNQIYETDPVFSERERYDLAISMSDYDLNNETPNRLSKLPPVSSKKTDTSLSIDIPIYDPTFDTDGKAYIPNHRVKSHIYDFTHNSNHIDNDTVDKHTAIDTIHDFILEDGVTNTETCNVLKTNGFHSKVVSEKLLMELLVTASRFSCFLKNLDTQNKKKRAAITKMNKKKPKKDRRNFEGLSITNNKTFLDQKCKLKDMGIEYLEIELTYNHARRVFSRGNKRFEYNGRFYGQVHQSIPSKLRKNIRINGEPVAEPDFSAMHPRMLYHQLRNDKRGDIYNIKEYPGLRDTFKAALLIAINAKTKKAAVIALGKRVYEKNLQKPTVDLDGKKIKTPMKWCISKILEAHKDIAEFICADKGIELMRKDSKIMENILMTLMKEDIPGLSVHDSVIVPKRYEARLRQVMMEEYKEVMGFYPVID